MTQTGDWAFRPPYRTGQPATLSAIAMSEARAAYLIKMALTNGLARFMTKSISMR